MRNSLVIVESPTKAKTIGNILGKEYLIISSMGHIIDLPKKQLGVDINQNFQPTFVVISGRQKVLSEIKKEAADKEKIYIATDPDREGEAIGWHIRQRLPKEKKFLRVIFHEITQRAIKESFLKPRDFDMNMIEAQFTRRVLDRIVGYFLSPLLWRKIGRGLSAGRVQSVALRLIVQREKEIQKFVPQEYWEIEAELKKVHNVQQSIVHSSFTAKLEKINEKKVQIKNKLQAERLIKDIKNKSFKISSVIQTQRNRNPAPPFITSTLQQEAFNKLRFTSNRTMIVAQQLYEGVEIDRDKPTGLITYMRTDSNHIASSALKEVRDFILNNFGKDYLPPSPNIYKIRKLAQEAHEAIRPTSLGYNPEGIKQFLSKDQYKLYDLIYRRFVASQMTKACYKLTEVKIEAGEYLFSAQGTEIIFAGFTKIYPQKEEKKILPALKQGELLNLISLIPSQHFTKGPSRYSEASLIKVLEEEGIGRPSTYAPIIQTIVNRDYVRRIKGYFNATELGIKVCDLLVEYFPRVLDIKFTAQMEEELDSIEEGQYDRLKVLNDFYQPFKSHLDFAQKNIKKEVISTDEVCEDCGRKMVIKWGRRGKFLSCSGFPKCKNAKPISTGVKCPQANCNGELIERRSRRGMFYGCSNFPKCRFTANQLPTEEK